MGAKLILSAALNKGDQTDSLMLRDGTCIPLPEKLPHSSNTEMVVAVMPRADYQLDQTTLAKHIIQEIISSE